MAGLPADPRGSLMDDTTTLDATAEQTELTAADIATDADELVEEELLVEEVSIDGLCGVY
jgi:mycofactocin precursor